MKKSRSNSKLKKELDKHFSLFIRLRDADSDGNVSCYTCGKVSHYKQSQCGHFVPRNILITRWNPQNCRNQDAGCNLWGNGRLLDFEEHLIKDIGAEAVEALKASRHQILKVSTAWYLEQIEIYKSLSQELLKNL